ncbi:Vitamin B12-binding protein [Austwickia sp. TVS 96-490-7B]|uniref:ABC transporter substrate-binding protein n=1 Tax=Austwickia sp. TVS 96-490-7B TaxID=2830843 RepID=UPI001C571820|nr:ABC transporter substrate-binding protein [Austwickia sp. TVS 96-490-7B]MBW3087080.1 Vitamin B12-binding protein [Austwickia sp. TVS 96-490-7B]
MITRHLRRHCVSALAVTLGIGALTGCGASSAKQSASSATSGTSSAISVETCGRTLSVPEPPKRVVFINSVGTSALQELGLLDRVIGRAGNLDTSVFEGAAKESLDKIPTIAGKDTGSGHISVSTESLIERKPDLVIGFTSAVDGAKLEAAKIPFYVPAAYCTKRPEGKITFDSVYKEVTTFGTLFGVSDKADKVNADLRSRVETVTKDHQGDAARTAAAVYVTPGDSKLSAYGNQGMSQPIFEAVGLKNIYADHGGRTFDLSHEDLLSKNPDVVLLLHSSGKKEEVLSTFTQTGGLSALKAVASHKVVVLPYPLTDPPSPLSVTGAERLAEMLGEKKD